MRKYLYFVKQFLIFEQKGTEVLAVPLFSLSTGIFNILILHDHQMKMVQDNCLSRWSSFVHSYQDVEKLRASDEPGEEAIRKIQSTISKKTGQFVLPNDWALIQQPWINYPLIKIPFRME